MDCFASLAMTVDTVSRSRDVIRPRFAYSSSALQSEGAGKTGCLPHPRSRVQVHTKNTHTSIQVRREHSGLPCATALRLITCSSRRTALLPPSPALLIASLAPAPRRPNHTTSPYASGAFVYRAISVHRISPRVRDDREAPLICREMGGVMPVIWVRTKAEYFCANGWTGFY
jgi:hypothetical protein